MNNTNTRDAYLIASARAFGGDWQLCEMLDNRLERLRGQVNGLRQSHSGGDQLRGFSASNTAGVATGRSPFKSPEVSSTGEKIEHIPDRLYGLEPAA